MQLVWNFAEEQYKHYQEFQSLCEEAPEGRWIGSVRTGDLSIRDMDMLIVMVL